MTNPLDELSNVRKVLIVGMARSGMAAAQAARKVLLGADVVLSDRQTGVLDQENGAALAQAGISVEPGRADTGLLEGCGLVIKSPGVPVDIPLLKEARLRGIPVWGEVEFAWRHLANPMVGVTGTNGKTTTTELIGYMLENAGRPCHVAGNVGTALSSLVGEIGGSEILVVELSSFQLEDSIDLRPDIAVLLNLTEDHLDRHPDADQYFESKIKIFANQRPGDLAVINRDDPNCRRLPIPGSASRIWFSREGSTAATQANHGTAEDSYPLVFAREGIIYADLAGLERLVADFACGASSLSGRNEPGGGEVSEEASAMEGGGTAPGIERIIAWQEASLKGEHNLDNSLAATAVCLALGLSPQEVAAGLKGFPGVRHRLQEVRIVDGVRYVNDSKATNVDAAIKALTAFGGGIHLILGGSLKGCFFDQLAAAASGSDIAEVIVIGESSDQIGASFSRIGREVKRAQGLEEAVSIASGEAAPGDVVLLSPACASFDQYSNYEERGEHFISLVNRL